MNAETVKEMFGQFVLWFCGLGIVPASNWEQLSEPDRPSRYWQGFTPSNTFVMTWQNVLLGGDANRPVSFQAEFFASGDVMFRYDLDRQPDGVLTNLVVGICNKGVGRVFTRLAKNTTSLRFAHLDPTHPFADDPDGDGLSTEDEIFVHRTDPYRADTDMDGLSDGAEVNDHETDPLDPHSVNPSYPDGMAVVLGDADPFSYPEGSTNTVWEHVFYTGTTNAPFAYPTSSDSQVVLRVTVSSSGSGELIVGDRVVPLLGNSGASAPARARARSGEAPRNANELMLNVGDRDWNYEKLLDSETKPTLNVPLAQWRRIAATSTYGRTTEAKLLVFGEGKAKLYFGYAGQAPGGAYVHDEAYQWITGVDAGFTAV